MKISKYVCEGSGEGGASEARQRSTGKLRRGWRAQDQVSFWRGHNEDVHAPSTTVSQAEW